ncbi:hypothetical protein SAMN04488052_101647 [Aquisalimonas asiatica]|uniref:YprB ribonuclease H-like domain-containing protein n=2 Tax=Aquisalimonas asiatica TaxID=406100 RepID=A0A1H8QM81_9GAMM|nr:hypothetical protein SAMN04488052_101647 [Aquisalimonas asiatica]
MAPEGACGKADRPPEGGGQKKPAVRARLDRLRAAARGANDRPRGHGDPDRLAVALGAECVEPGVVRVDTHLSPGARHGCTTLPPGDAAVRFPGWPRVLLRDLAFLDTETSGLAGGTGTVAFNIGVLRWADGAWRSRQYLLTGFGGEAPMLRALASDLRECRGLVTYNGGSFDLPLLRDRYRLQRQPDPHLPTAHLDLLHPVRRLYRNRWSDCRLASAEAALLGLERGDDLPGAEVPAVWFDWVHRGRGERFGAVLQHNRLDILSLLALMPALAGAVRAPGRWGACPLGAARYWRQQGQAGRARLLLERAEDLDFNGQHELARLRHRGGWGEGAVALWEALAARGCPRALEQLAKYHEHVRHDMRTALALAERLPASVARERRRARLLRRCGAERTLPLDL